MYDYTCRFTKINVTDLEHTLEKNTFKPSQPGCSKCALRTSGVQRFKFASDAKIN